MKSDDKKSKNRPASKINEHRAPCNLEWGEVSNDLGDAASARVIARAKKLKDAKVLVKIGEDREPLVFLIVSDNGVERFDAHGRFVPPEPLHLR